MFEITIEIDVTYDDANTLYRIYENKLADIGWQYIFGNMPVEDVYSIEDVKAVHGAWKAINQALINGDSHIVTL